MTRKAQILFSLILLTSVNVHCQTIKIDSIGLNTISNLGIAYSEYDTINAGLYKPYYEVFQNEFLNILTNSGVKNISFTEVVISFESISESEIIEICKNQSLDAFLISKIYFLRNSFIYKSFLNLDEIEDPSMITGKADVYMELKIFNKFGQLMIWTTHKVQTGSSSMVSPKWTINKGLKKTIKKLNKN